MALMREKVVATFATQRQRLAAARDEYAAGTDFHARAEADALAARGLDCDVIRHYGQLIASEEALFDALPGQEIAWSANTFPRRVTRPSLPVRWWRRLRHGISAGPHLPAWKCVGVVTLDDNRFLKVLLTREGHVGIWHSFGYPWEARPAMYLASQGLYGRVADASGAEYILCSTDAPEPLAARHLIAPEGVSTNIAAGLLRELQAAVDAAVQRIGESARMRERRAAELHCQAASAGPISSPARPSGEPSATTPTSAMSSTAAS
jgi:hypothetical protein